MITTDNNRRADLARGDQVVEGQTGLVPLAVAEPANPSRQALEADLFSSAAQPLLQPIIIAKQIHDCPVGDLDVMRISGQRHPPERALTLTKQRPDISRYEAWKLKRAFIAAQPSLVANRVAVIEDLGTGILKPHHRLNMASHAGPGAIGEFLRFLLGIAGPVLHADPLRQVGQRVMGTGLISENVDRYTATEKLRKDLSAVADDTNGGRLSLIFRRHRA